MINIFIIGFFLVTTIGQDAWGRWRNKQRYKKGGFVHSLILTKEGNVQEVFTKVKEGKFSFKELPYIRNPRLLLNFRGIPTYIHREDEPAPVNMWGKDFDSILMSAAEMDTVMNSQVNFDFKEWLSKYLPYFLMGLVVVVGAILALAYFDYMSYQMLRDGSFKAVEIIANNAIPQVIPPSV
jgi:hypothetical protein